MVLMVSSRADLFPLGVAYLHHIIFGYLAGTPAAQERYAWLSDGFQERFGSRPALFARAPGNLYAVLSCAEA